VAPLTARAPPPAPLWAAAPREALAGTEKARALESPTGQGAPRARLVPALAPPAVQWQAPPPREALR